MNNNMTMLNYCGSVYKVQSVIMPLRTIQVCEHFQSQNTKPHSERVRECVCMFAYNIQNNVILHMLRHMIGNHAFPFYNHASFAVMCRRVVLRCNQTPSPSRTLSKLQAANKKHHAHESHIKTPLSQSNKKSIHRTFTLRTNTHTHTHC